MQTATTLIPERLHKMDAYWRAANDLSVGQMYLYDDPLLKPGCRSSLGSFRFPEAFPATPRQNARARSTGAASWAMRSAMRSGRCSTIPI